MSTICLTFVEHVLFDGIPPLGIIRVLILLILIATLQGRVGEVKHFSLYPSKLLAEVPCDKRQINGEKQAEVYYDVYLVCTGKIPRIKE